MDFLLRERKPPVELRSFFHMETTAEGINPAMPMLWEALSREYNTYNTF